MTEKLTALFNDYKLQNEELKKNMSRLSMLRREINEEMEKERIGLLVRPFFPDWKDRHI